MSEALKGLVYASRLLQRALQLAEQLDGEGAPAAHLLDILSEAQGELQAAIAFNTTLTEVRDVDLACRSFSAEYHRSLAGIVRDAHGCGHVVAAPPELHAALAALVEALRPIVDRIETARAARGDDA